VSNPLSTIMATEQPPPTQTVPQREIYHDLTAQLKSIMGGVQTREQLNDVRERLDAEARSDTLQDPRTLSRKGRPLTRRLTGATEGRPQGGGGLANGGENPRRQNCCSRCHKPGHNRSRCPWEGLE
ncbi:hypothetical protein C8R47DRAFT_997523, partial [Mycena vitilis]